MRNAGRFIAFALAFAAGLPIITEAPAQEGKAKAKADPKPLPDFANVSYGPHERNVMDVWKAKSDQPTPLLVFIHECVVRHEDEGVDLAKETVAFLKKHLKVQ